MGSSKLRITLAAALTATSLWLPAQTEAALSPTTWVAPQKTLSVGQISGLINDVITGMAQRSLTIREAGMLTELRTLANDTAFIYQGEDGSPLSTQQTYERNFKARMLLAQSVAEKCYGRSNTASITLAKNAYILMTYDALVRLNPQFYWARLGIFAANEVRSNLALAFSVKNALDKIIAASPASANVDILPGLSLSAAAQVAGQVNADLLEGQSNVLANIGSLALLHKRFGSAALASLSGLTPEAKQGYLLQEQAEQAWSTPGQTANGHLLATQAAIQFGIHEQAYLLQPMWDKPTLKIFSQLNQWLLSRSAEQIGMRGDIFVGTNKFMPYVAPYLIIRAPIGATNLGSIEDRVAIARNGFTTLDTWNQNAMLAQAITQSQTRLGQGQGIYQAALARASLP